MGELLSTQNVTCMCHADCIFILLLAQKFHVSNDRKYCYETEFVNLLSQNRFVGKAAGALSCISVRYGRANYMSSAFVDGLHFTKDFTGDSCQAT